MTQKRSARVGASGLLRLAFMSGAAAICFATPAAAQDEAMLDRLEALEQKFNSLEAENQSLRQELETLRQSAQQAPKSAEGQQNAAQPLGEGGIADTIGISPNYAFAMLDHAVNVNSKPLVQLEALRDGQLNDRITLSGQVTAITNYQWSNRNSKFGYLMRHPTSNNQIGKHVSEAVLHSANIALTGRLTSDVTAYAELLYDPEQSFGSGTITALARNQMQLRRGWVMWGNLDKAPVYGLVGKMDIPFGLNDTVSPFTNSTNWHAFAGLAYGAQLGLYTEGFHLRAMAVQGGAQFRSANTSVDGTNVPSRLNNFAIDGRYTLSLNDMGDGVMVGGSYQHGTAYCQGYPVFHFNPCADNNPAYAFYGKLDLGSLQLLGEYAQTTKVWPGSNVPDPTNPLSIYPAVKTKAFTTGAKYAFGDEVANTQERRFAISAEFSRFIAGADESPWKRQNQSVLGLSWFPVSNFNVFGEFIHVDGFVPLNFLSGGNFPDGSTWSERGATTDVILIGATAAF